MQHVQRRAGGVGPVLTAQDVLEQLVGLVLTRCVGDDGERREMLKDVTNIEGAKGSDEMSEKTVLRLKCPEGTNTLSQRFKRIARFLSEQS